MKEDPSIKESLRVFYNQDAQRRNESSTESWKLTERTRFLEELQQQDTGNNLLELGAGAGKDSLYFQDQGFTVTAIDLSPEMVKLCKEKQLNAHVMDFTQLSFPAETFAAVYAFNSLLHTPKKALLEVLEDIRRVLEPKGLFYLGVYGGNEFEGVWQEDWSEPKRFFAYYTDKALLEIVSSLFELVYFRRVAVERGADFHFQSIILRKN
jgi:ubiquinone/menaquinone biosynthesis C-methylase UbiE